MGPKGLPIVKPSIRRKMRSLKLNCTFLVAIHNISLQTALGKVSRSSSELYSLFKQIFETSSSGTIVKKNFKIKRDIIDIKIYLVLYQNCVY